MDRQDTPHPENAVRATIADPFGRVAKYRFTTGNAESLASMESDYAFFTPAALYLHGRFTDMYLADFIQDFASDCKFLWHKFRYPLFRGLEDADKAPDWNFVLFAVERGYWEAFCAFINTITVSDSNRKQLWRYGTQDLIVTDPVALEQSMLLSATTPPLKVTAFGVDAGHFRAAFDPGLNVLTDPPRLRFYPPADDIEVFAEAHFAGKNPLHAQERFRRIMKEKGKA